MAGARSSSWGPPASARAGSSRSSGPAPADLPLVTVACDPYEATSPYAPFWWLLHDLLEQPPTADARRIAATASTESVRLHAPHLEPWIPLLGIPLDLDLAPTPETAALAPEFSPTRCAR